MDFLTIMLIAVGLAMDAFAVAITNGFTVKNIKLIDAVRIAFFFGAFQFLMPLLGWLAGLGLKNLILSIDHWIAFGLLVFIGGKMIYEAVIQKNTEKKETCLKLPVLLLLSLATSIDALAVGLSLSLLNISIMYPVIIIGGVTFLISFIGVFIGKKFGYLLGEKMEIFGGIILIGIGIKILIEHINR
ncbi:MAG: manganese efflux pump MntP family protein [bacterium]|nr:manganese efflux pump MntP family protein [bacterium]